MRFFLATVFVVAAFGGLLEDQAAFASWKAEYARSYGTPEEDAFRFAAFQKNLRHYEERNAHDTAVFGPDDFSDLTEKEFNERVGGTMPEDCLQSGNEGQYLSDEEIASILKEHDSSIDWRTKGAVTPVKNQGQYGTCWAFGATGTTEGMGVVGGNLTLESVSEQELIDCSPCGGYVGCCISWYKDKTKGKANLESGYPYKGRSGSCQKDSAPVAKLTTKDRICEANGAKSNQDNVLALLIKHGPGACLIDAGCVSGYKSGIISNCPRKAGSINHATLFVGAGEDGGVPYWIVKNSWGTSFGMSGYYKMKRNTDPPQAGVPGGIFALPG